MRDGKRWWVYEAHEIAVAMLIGFVFGLMLHFVCGCSSPAVSEPKYPEYDKWWAARHPIPVVTYDGTNVSTNSFEGLGQGDVYVHEYVTTNLVLGADGLRREVVTNRTEAVLL